MCDVLGEDLHCICTVHSVLGGRRMGVRLDTEVWCLRYLYPCQLSGLVFVRVSFFYCILLVSYCSYLCNSRAARRESCDCAMSRVWIQGARYRAYGTGHTVQSTQCAVHCTMDSTVR